MRNCCSPGCRWWYLWWCLFVLSFSHDMSWMRSGTELSSFWGFSYLLLYERAIRDVYTYILSRRKRQAPPKGRKRETSKRGRGEKKKGKNWERKTNSRTNFKRSRCIKKQAWPSGWKTSSKYQLEWAGTATPEITYSRPDSRGWRWGNQVWGGNTNQHVILNDIPLQYHGTYKITCGSANQSFCRLNRLIIKFLYTAKGAARWVVEWSSGERCSVMIRWRV